MTAATADVRELIARKPRAETTARLVPRPDCPPRGERQLPASRRRHRELMGYLGERVARFPPTRRGPAWVRPTRPNRCKSGIEWGTRRVRSPSSVQMLSPDAHLYGGRRSSTRDGGERPAWRSPLLRPLPEAVGCARELRRLLSRRDSQPHPGRLAPRPLPIRAYAVCILLGIVAACVITEVRLRHRGAPKWMVLDVAVWAVPFGIIGARIYHVITSPDAYFGSAPEPARSRRSRSGMAAWASGERWPVARWAPGSPADGWASR